jgi:hypothetical protein
VDYQRLATENKPSVETWERFVCDVLVQPWLDAYAAMTPWVARVVETRLGSLTYLFDAAPSLSRLRIGDDRVVAVWGYSRAPASRRDVSRQSGFVPVPASWSERDRDRGHFVAHAAGGGMDINFFPQAKGLNRGTTPRGKVWRAMERRTTQPGTPLFVRAIYRGSTWVPEYLDYGVLLGTGLWCERFENRD